ncbi:MAG: tetratricopeptide repeat protein [Pirellulaceae bacterium]
MSGKVVWAFCLVAAQGLMMGAAIAQSGKDAGKETAKDSEKRVVGIYTDAAGFQNNGAYELAIEEWSKLLDEFPDHPLASKASHYLGVSYIQAQEYDKAITAFKRALKDSKLKVREESLINLSWCLFTQARTAPIGSTSQKTGFRDAKKQLNEFMSQYAKGDFADQALFYLGEIEYTQGNARKAVSYYSKLLADPRFKKSKLLADAQYAIAVAYEEQKDPRNARKSYERFLAAHSDHRLVQEVRVRLADLLLADNNAAEAQAILAPASAKGEMADYALLRLGYALARQGKTDEATKQYRMLLEKFPDSQHKSAAAISVGQAYYQAGKFDEAVKNFELAVGDRDTQSADAAHWMSVTLMRQGKADKALEIARDALTWAENSVALRMDYADALYATPNQLEKARAAYELIATENAKDSLAPRAGYNAAFAALQMRDYEKAREWAEWFLTRFPRDPLRNDVAYVAAETLLQEGEHKSAAKAYEQLIGSDGKKEHPSYDLWMLRLGMSRYLSGDYGTAIREIEGAIERFRQPAQRAEAEFILGASYLYSEKVSEAIKHLLASRKASDQWGSADEVLLLLAEAQQRSEDSESAKKTLEDLLKKYPRSRLKAQAEYKLGQLSAATGDFTNAVVRYQGILGDPDAANLHAFAEYGIAWCEMQQERYEVALKSLRKVLASNSASSIRGEAQLALGVCLRKTGATDDSISALETFLSTSPKGLSLGNGLYEVGLAYTEKGKLAEANRVFSRLLKEVPDYPARDKVIYELAWNARDSSDEENAEKYFARLVSEYPRSEFSGEAVYMVAQKLYGQGDYAKAADNYSAVLSKTKDAGLLEKTYYKLGWSLFQQERFTDAAKYFAQQATKYSNGSLAIDAFFMQAECSFKQKDYKSALASYADARGQLESRGKKAVASEQVKVLIYLHGAQCHRELEDWRQCESWLKQITDRYPESPYIATALYELAYARQKQDRVEEALKLYSEVANNYRNDVGARARFMMGELYFGEQDFVKAIPEFQRVMYGYGGDKAPEAIKNWQVKSAFEAARCSEILIEKLDGSAREKLIRTAQEFYTFIVNKHSAHDLAAKAQSRLGELKSLR